MNSLLSAIGKWFAAQGLAVKAAIAVVSVAVVAGGGTAIYMGVTSGSNNNKPATNNTIVTDKQDPTEASKPDDSTQAPDTKTDADSEKGDSTEETTPSDSTSTDVIDPVIDDEDSDDEDDYVIPFTKTTTDLYNGTFADGINGFEVYAVSEDAVSYTADAQNGFQITINSTGTEDWHVQLKQTEIKLEKGKWYRLSMDAKSTVNRNVTSVMQRNGLYDNDWTPYCKTNLMALTNTWNTFTTIFQMTEATDMDTVFNVSMGSVNGVSVTKEHTVGIRNIKLEQLSDNWIDSLKVGANLIGNGDFAYGDILWDGSVNGTAAAKVSFTDNKATFDISNPGTLDWHVQLKQTGISLKKDQGYRFTFKASSTADRTIKVGFMDTNYVNWYGGGDIELKAGETKLVTVEFKNGIDTNPAALMMISMGKIEGQKTPASVITLSDMVLVEANDVNASASSGAAWKDPNTKLANGFTVYDHMSTHTNGSSYDDAHGYAIHVRDVGTEEWHVQMQKKNVLLEKDNWYRVSFKVRSTTNRPVSFMLQHDGSLDNNWTPYSKTDGSQIIDVPESAEMYSFDDWQTYTQVFQMTSDTDPYTIFNFALGKVNGTPVNCMHTVWITDIVLEQTEAPEIGSIPLNTEMLTMAPSIYVAEDQGAAATVNNDGDKVIYNITRPGTADWNVQHKYTDLVFEQGCTYELALDAISTPARFIQVGIFNSAYNWYGGGQVELLPAQTDSSANHHTFRFTMTEETIADGLIQISLGQIDDKEIPVAEVTINNVSLMKVAEAGESGEPETGDNMLQNGNFANGDAYWYTAYQTSYGSEGTASFTDNKATFDISNAGSEGWHVQMLQGSLNIEKGAKYQLSFKAISSVNRSINYGLQKNHDDYSGYSSFELALTAGEEATITKDITMDHDTDSNAAVFFNLGNATGAHTVSIYDVKLVKTADAPEGDDGEDEFDGSITVTQANWTNNELTMADILGDIDPGTVSAIQFSGDTNFAVGFKTTDYADYYVPEEERSNSYTFTNMLLATKEVNGENVYPYVSIGVWTNAGESHTISWKVIVAEAPVLPSVTYSTAGWTNNTIALEQLLGDIDPSTVSAVKFDSDTNFAVGFKTTDYADYYVPEGERSNSYTFTNMLLATKEVNGEKVYPYVSIGIWINEGEEHVLTWEVITEN